MYTELYKIAGTANNRITNEKEYNNAVANLEYLRIEIKSHKNKIFELLNKLSNMNIVLSAYNEVLDDLNFRVEEWEMKDNG